MTTVILLIIINKMIALKHMCIFKYIYIYTYIVTLHLQIDSTTTAMAQKTVSSHFLLGESLPSCAVGTGRIMPILNFGIQWECPWALLSTPVVFSGQENRMDNDNRTGQLRPWQFSWINWLFNYGIIYTFYFDGFFFVLITGITWALTVWM